MQQAQTKAIVLARVSSKAQEDEGYSLDSQVKLMRDYCKNKKLDVVYEFKITETASKDQRRKIYQEMLNYISKHRVFNVVVEKTDRLTRNFKDATMIDTWLEKDDRRRLHMVKENLLLHKEARSDAKFMWNIYLSVAKKYTDNLREEAMKGWVEKLSQGWLPAEPPPGYKTIIKDGKRIHVLNPETYQYLPRIFQLATLPGYTRKKLSEEMALVGLTTKTGRPFSVSFVTKVLTNPFYIGINRLQGKEYPGAQEPIITKKLFYEVQRKIKNGRQDGHMRTHNPIFKRIMTCDTCDTLVCWYEGKGRYYGTCLKRRDGCWGYRYLREDRVEAVIIRELSEIDDPKSRLLTKIKDILQIVKPQDIGLYRQKMLDELGAKLQRMQRMEENLYEDKLAGYISKEKYEEKCLSLAKQAAEITARIAMLREAQGAAKQPEEEPQSDNPIVDLYLGSTPNQKRIILTTLFKKIFVKDGAVILTLK